MMPPKQFKAVVAEDLKLIHEMNLALEEFERRWGVAWVVPIMTAVTDFERHVKAMGYDACMEAEAAAPLPGDSEVPR